MEMLLKSIFFISAMKYLAVILLSYLTILMVEPVAYEVYAMTRHHSCCHAACCAKSKQCSDNLPASCNNCATCSICLGSYIHETGFKFHEETVTSTFAYPNNDQLISNYYSNCFRPPKIV